MTIAKLKKMAMAHKDFMCRYLHRSPQVVKTFRDFTDNVLYLLDNCALFVVDVHPLSHFADGVEYHAIMNELTHMKLPFPITTLHLFDSKEHSERPIILTTYNVFMDRVRTDWYNGSDLAGQYDLSQLDEHSEETFVCIEGSHLLTMNNSALTLGFMGNVTIVQPHSRAVLGGSATGQIGAVHNSEANLSSTMSVMYAFLKLLSCKNVEVRKRTHDHKKMKGRMSRRNDLDYHEIVIKVPGKRVIYQGEPIEEIPVNECAKYGICGSRMGHFKTYTADKPLFGKHTGTWWWSPIFDTRQTKEYRVEVDVAGASNIKKQMEQQK